MPEYPSLVTEVYEHGQEWTWYCSRMDIRVCVVFSFSVFFVVVCTTIFICAVFLWAPEHLCDHGLDLWDLLMCEFNQSINQCCGSQFIHTQTQSVDFGSSAVQQKMHVSRTAIQEELSLKQSLQVQDAGRSARGRRKLDANSGEAHESKHLVPQDWWVYTCAYKRCDKPKCGATIRACICVRLCKLQSWPAPVAPTLLVRTVPRSAVTVEVILVECRFCKLRTRIFCCM